MSSFSTAKPAYAILFGLLLCAAQLVVAAHELEHLADNPGAQETCELCLAASGIEQTLAAAAESPAAILAAVAAGFFGAGPGQKLSLASLARGPPAHFISSS